MTTTTPRTTTLAKRWVTTGLRICLWGLGKVSSAEARLRISHVVGVRNLLTRVIVVQQPRDKRWRCDVFTKTEGQRRDLFSLLKDAGHKEGWFVRLHVSYGSARRVAARKRAALLGSPAVQSNSSVLDPLGSGVRFLSINVNGLRSKGRELMRYVRQHRVDILAIQETRLSAQDRGVLTRCGYLIQHRFAQDGSSRAEDKRPGARGVSLAVSKGLCSYNWAPGDIGQSPYFVAAAVLLKPSSGVDTGVAKDRSALFGSVYIPVSKHKASRVQALCDVRRLLQAWIVKHPGSPVYIAGDWNHDRKALVKLLGRWKLPLRIVSLKGDDRTYHKKGIPKSAIDHVVVLASPVEDTVRSALCDQTQDMSDHFPIITDIGLETLSSELPTGKRSRFKIMKTPLLQFETQVAIRHHNLFQVLDKGLNVDATTSSQEGINAESDSDLRALADKQTQRFLSTSKEVLVRTGAAVSGDKPARRRSSGSRKRADFLSRNTLKAIRIRRSLLIKLRQAVRTRSNVARSLHARYRKAVERANDLRKRDERRHWLAQVAEGVKLFGAGGNPPKFWKWVKDTALGGEATSLPTMRPMRVSADGPLITDPTKLLEAWTAHFSSLASDVSGNGSNQSHWEGILPPSEDPEQALPINQPISWKEIVRTVRNMPAGKACPDGISIDYIKVLVEDPSCSDKDSSAPTTPAARVFYDMVRNMWKARHVPSMLRCALVIAIPKAGRDHQLFDNYRGISLIQVVLKVLASVLAKRISKCAEGRLHKAQGGFRDQAEAVGQFITLAEICQRRQTAEPPGEASLPANERSTGDTYLAFVDFRKAFDTVPHAALIRKLERFGIRGACLQYISEMYRTSQLAVCTPAGVGDSFHQARGVRQGCPLSPVLFNIFVDDLLQEGRRSDLGVLVPGLAERVPGLTFADDLVLLASTRQNLDALVQSVDRWCARWEMAANASKCGLMVVPQNRDLGDGLQAELAAASIRIGGGVIPAVDSYKYLGLVFDRRLYGMIFTDGMRALVQQRRRQVQKSAGVLASSLGDPNIPVHLRRSIFRAMIESVAAYGGEFLGMTDFHGPIEAVLDKQLRCITHTRGRYASIVALYLELDLPTLGAIMHGRRARAFQKFGASNLIIGDLVRCFNLANPQAYDTKQLGQGWVCKTGQWLTSTSDPRSPSLECILDISYPSSIDPSELPTCKSDIPPRKYAKAVQVWSAQCELCVTGQSPKTLKAYSECQLGHTNQFIRQSVKDSSIAFGMSLLTMIRVGGFAGVARAAHVHALGARARGLTFFNGKCPNCTQQRLRSRFAKSYGSFVKGERETFGSTRRTAYDTLDHLLFHCESFQGERARHLLPILHDSDDPAAARFREWSESEGHKQSFEALSSVYGFEASLLLGCEVLDNSIYSPSALAPAGDHESGNGDNEFSGVEDKSKKRLPRLVVGLARFLQSVYPRRLSALRGGADSASWSRRLDC